MVDPTLAEAVRLLLDFPTDEMVGAANDATGNDFETVRDVLAAVRRVMFGPDK